MLGLAHPGVRATRRLISSRYVWPRLNADVSSWCRDCLACQRAKVTRQPPAPAESIPATAQRFTQIHIDLVGPLPVAAGGQSHILTVVDRATRWAEAIPLSSATTAACAATLISGWVSRYGVPCQLTSDRGVQFTSAVWSSLTATLGIRHVLTTPYHPQSNGLVERFHCRLKDALKARLSGPSWPEHLPWVMLGLRSAPREDSGVLPAELTFGGPLTLPGLLIDSAAPPPESFLAALRSCTPAVSSTPPVAGGTSPASAAAFAALQRAAFVFVRSPPNSPALTPAYRGPYRVEKRGQKVFVLQVGGRFESHSVDRLKPCLAASPTAAMPPKRGRPPAVSGVSSFAPHPPAKVLGGSRCGG